MLLHRLFENRAQIPPQTINTILATHVAEYYGFLMCRCQSTSAGEMSSSSRGLTRRIFSNCLKIKCSWLRNAQETRDLIRILANLFKSRGDGTPILTAADFRLDDDAAGILALLDSGVERAPPYASGKGATQYHFRDGRGTGPCKQRAAP